MRIITPTRKSLTKSLAIVIAALGLAAVPAQPVHAAPGDGIAENCKKVSTGSAMGTHWRCTNILGYSSCDVYTGGVTGGSYSCTVARSPLDIAAAGDLGDQRDRVANELRVLIDRQSSSSDSRGSTR